MDPQFLQLGRTNERDSLGESSEASQ